MVQITSYKTIRGLDLNSNPLTGTPGKDYAGTARSATVIADNCVLSRQRMLSNRRGFDYFSNPTTAQVNTLFEYQNYLLQHQTDNTLWYSTATSGTRTQYTGTYAAPAGYAMDGAVGRGNFYFTTNDGLYKLDKATNTPLKAGISKGLDTRVTTTGTGGGFMNGFSKCGYHVTWVRTDANNQQVRGDVSTKPIVTNNTRQTVTSVTQVSNVATCTTPVAHNFNTGDTILMAGATQTQYNGSFSITKTGTTTFTYPISGSPTSPATGTITCEKQMNTSITFTVPWDVQPNDSYEIWRTITKDASNADPGDDCYLVSKVLNAGAAGSTVTFTDTTPDSILTAGLPLYTNATKSGALSGQARPPYCTCMCNYKDYQIYGNTAIDHQLTNNLLAVASLVSGTSKLIINNVAGQRVYTFGAAENVATQTVQIFTGGISNASNIEQTVRSLVHVINGDSAGSWYAEYTSGPNDNPGIFRVWARSPLSGNLWLQADTTTTGNQFSPAIPTTGQTVASSNDARPNRLFYSVYQQPDAVPILNTIDVGRLDQPILRVLSVRDACYVVKADGIYYLSGLTAPFSMIELDSTCHCIAPRTCVTLNNQLFFYSNQGIVKVSTSGVTVISFDIEPVIMGNLLTLSNLFSVAFGVAHEADRHYILWLPTNSSDTYGTQAFCYHTFINEWTGLTKPAVAGITLNSNYSLYLSSGVENAIIKQRRNGDATDYSDESQNITINSQTGQSLDVTWPSALFLPAIGCSIHQGGSVAKVIAVQQVSGTHYILTTDRVAIYTPGAATGRMPIYAHARLSPNTCGETEMSKSIYAVTFFLTGDTVTQSQIEVATNEAGNLQTFPMTRAISTGWGLSPWGATPWGDSTNPNKSVPWQIALSVPDITGEWVTAGWIHAVSQEQFSIAQVAFAFDQLAEYEVTA
jgi:hypothetical protein